MLEYIMVVVVVLVIVAAPLWFLWKGRQLDRNQQARQAKAHQKAEAHHQTSATQEKPSSSAGGSA